MLMSHFFESEEPTMIEAFPAAEAGSDDFKSQLEQEGAELTREIAEIEKLKSKARSKMGQLRALGYGLTLIISLLAPIFGSEARAQDMVKQVLFSESVIPNSLPSAPEQEDSLGVNPRVAELRERLVHEAKPYIITPEEIKAQFKSPLFEGCEVKIIPDSFNLRRGFAGVLSVGGGYSPYKNAILILPLRINEEALVRWISSEYFFENAIVGILGDTSLSMPMIDSLLANLELERARSHQWNTLDSLPAKIINDTATVNLAFECLETKRNRRSLSETINHEAFHYLYHHYFFTEDYEGPAPHELIERLKNLNHPQSHRFEAFRNIADMAESDSLERQYLDWALYHHLSFSDVDFASVFRAYPTFLEELNKKQTEGTPPDYLQKLYGVHVIGRLLDEYLARIYDCSKGYPDDIQELDEWEQNFMRTVKLKGVALADIPKIEIPPVKIPAPDTDASVKNKIEEIIK